MKPIPIFQIIRIDDTRVVIRHYNEQADKFEKVCSAQDDAYLRVPSNYRLIRDKLLITPEGRICYSYNGRLYYPGNTSLLVTVLSATEDALQMLDISVLRLPVRYLFISQQGDNFEEVVSYDRVDDGVKLLTLAGCTVRYVPQTSEYEDPDMGPVSLTILYRS